MIRTRTAYKNKIHSILAKYEHKSPVYKIFSKKGIKWLQEIELTETARIAMDAYLDGIKTTQKQIDTFESKMATLSKDDQRIRLLMTIPGINYTTALTVISEIVDISRFATPEKMVSYAGLAPSQRNSGETKKSGNITKYDSSWLRYAMVEAAHTTIQNDERIKKFYSRIASRRGPQKAKVAAAKEMLGEYIMSRYILTQDRETMYRMIAYNCYRITRNHLVIWYCFYRAIVIIICAHYTIVFPFKFPSLIH